MRRMLSRYDAGGNATSLFHPHHGFGLRAFRFERCGTPHDWETPRVSGWRFYHDPLAEQIMLKHDEKENGPRGGASEPFRSRCAVNTGGSNGCGDTRGQDNMTFHRFPIKYRSSPRNAPSRSKIEAQEPGRALTHRDVRFRPPLTPPGKRGATQTGVKAPQTQSRQISRGGPDEPTGRSNRDLGYSRDHKNWCRKARRAAIPEARWVGTRKRTVGKLDAKACDGCREAGAALCLAEEKTARKGPEGLLLFAGMARASLSSPARAERPVSMLWHDAQGRQEAARRSHSPNFSQPLAEAGEIQSPGALRGLQLGKECE